MKAKDIAKMNNIPRVEFEEFIKVSDLQFTQHSLGGMELPNDTNVPELLALYDEYKKERVAIWESYQEKTNNSVNPKKLTLEQIAERKERQIKLANILVSSGFDFDGYKITNYSGYISSDDAIEIGRGTFKTFAATANTRDRLTDSLSAVRKNALLKLKNIAYDLGCNAIIGVSFNYITFDPETENILAGGTVYLPYIVCVTASGNAVIIEKNNE